MVVTRRLLVVYMLRGGRTYRWRLPHAGLHTVVGSLGTVLVTVTSNDRGTCPCTRGPLT
jgi:hypothetical protein